MRCTFQRVFYYAFILSVLYPVTPSAAPLHSTLIGKIVHAETGEPLSGVSVELSGKRGTFTSEQGLFVLGSLPLGQYELRTSIVGFRSLKESITLTSGDTTYVQLKMEVQPIELPGIEVSVLRPDLRPQTELNSQDIRETRVRDAGELLRNSPGLDAVRRGPLGLDPVVRGLRESEVGVYIDGARTFPAGPGRMDSPMSHLDPSAVERIQVVKGPYALTWGAGNLSAIRIRTPEIDPAEGRMHGRIQGGYSANDKALESAASFYGGQDQITYWVHSAWRQGDDYESGAGTSVPADFTSREIRGKIGFHASETSNLTLTAGYQKQDDIDYPGRLLNADFFKAYNVSAEWRLRPVEGRLKSIEILAYHSDVDHGMGNWDKPTSLPNPNRMPPFAIDVSLGTGVTVWGGRAAAEYDLKNGWLLELGSDINRANRNADRVITRADNGMVMFQDIIWPDATITDAGFFLRASGTPGWNLHTSATARIDLVHASAGTVSDFFRQNASRTLDHSERNWSGAFTAGRPINDSWTASLGIGTAVRTADATERYSDRLPASKSQMSAEFMGNPELDPERSTQIDLWLEGLYPKVSFHASGFFRRINDYITLAPTTLPKRLPLSPNTVFRYLNGDAEFWGFELSATANPTPPITLKLGASYLWGKDKTQNEPAIGIPPFKANASLRYNDTAHRFYLESTAYAVASQNRAAKSRGEQTTVEYATANLKTGLFPINGVELQLGINNLFDKNHTTHLNARDPFTGQRVLEPGRTVFAHINYGF